MEVQRQFSWKKIFSANSNGVIESENLLWSKFLLCILSILTPVLWPPHAKSWLTGKDWCWEGLGAGGEGDDRGWDGWMASPTQRTWVWVDSRSLWWTGRPGVLRFMGRKESDTTEQLNWTELNWMLPLVTFSLQIPTDAIYLYGAEADKGKVS